MCQQNSWSFAFDTISSMKIISTIQNDMRHCVWSTKFFRPHIYQYFPDDFHLFGNEFLNNVLSACACESNILSCRNENFVLNSIVAT